MSAADIVVTIFVAVFSVLITAIISLAMTNIKNAIKGLQETVDLKISIHDEKNRAQDDHMAATDAKVERHERTLGSHEMRIHDTEVSFARLTNK